MVPEANADRANNGMNEAWGRLSQAGWDGGHPHLAALYPMPGDERFDDDEQFSRIPIFPGTKGNVVCAGDHTWYLPRSWFRELETRPESQTVLKFNLPLEDEVRLAGVVMGTALIRMVQKAMYLEAFRARKPLAVSTFKRRLNIYGAFARVAVACGKRLPDLDYGDLANAVALMNKTDRGSLPAVYETLRWWKARSGVNFPFFDPPPSPEALLTTDVSAGFDPRNIREDKETAEDTSFQPLSDAFVAAAGGIAITLVEVVRPLLLRCLREFADYRRLHGQVPSEGEAREIIRQYEWPQDFRPENYAEFRQRCRQTQTATIFLLSLLIGPRSSEVLGIPRGRVSQIVVDGEVMYFLDAATFKLSQNYGGESRDWPIHEVLGQALEQQDEYIDLTEGEQFQYLWKQHLDLFGGSAWLKEVDGQLEDFVQQFRLERYLDGTRCHHHRFRKTTARLIVIALYGGPVVLRRLFGHQHLAMTLRYILANTSIIDELREIAQAEQRAIAEEYASRSGELLGKGGETFREALAAAAEVLSVTVPDGKREQAEFTAPELVAFLGDGPDGLTIKQILPGLLACFKPRDAAGACCSSNEMPNVAQCSAECKWQMMLPEFEEQAARNVDDALEHLAGDPGNPLNIAHYKEVVVYWSKRFPDLATRFNDRNVYNLVMGAA